MEGLKEKILEFLKLSPYTGHGRGYGNGSSACSGNGSINGDGFVGGFDVSNLDSLEGFKGFGKGKSPDDECGSGLGRGNSWDTLDGTGSDKGEDIFRLKSINGQQVHKVDGIPSIIIEIQGGVAKAFVVGGTWGLQPCFIIKKDGQFAHGATLREAYDSLQRKIFALSSPAERVEQFRKTYPDFNAKIPARELFEWHGRLTGSCRMGRISFARDHGIDVDNDAFSVTEFVELTKDAYGGEVIRLLIDKKESVNN